GPRYGHAAVYDASNHRMILFGGSSAVPDAMEGQVWVFTFIDATFASGTWSTLAVTGPAPEPRRDHTLVLDPDLPALFVFGGISASGPSSTLWKLDLSPTPAVWSVVAAGGDVPAPRAGHAAFYDNDDGAQRMYIFGGEPTSSTLLDEFAYTIKLSDS